MKNNIYSFKLQINNNIAIFESNIIYFCLRSNFRKRTTLTMMGKLNDNPEPEFS